MCCLLLGCPNGRTCTLILRGGSEQFLEETERSLHDAIMIVRRTIKNDSVVAGKLYIYCNHNYALQTESALDLKNQASQDAT